MAIAFRSAASASVSGATPVVVNKPAGVVSGDLLLAVVAVGTSSVASVTAPSGWALIDDTNNPFAPTLRQLVYWKFAGGSEPSTYTWTLAAPRDAAAAILAYTGVDPTAPIHLDASQTGSNEHVESPSLNTSRANTKVVSVHGIGRQTGLSTPADTTSRAAVVNAAGVDVSLRVVDFDRASIGATGPKQSLADTGGSYVAYQVALTPGNTAPTAPVLLTPVGGTAVDLDAYNIFDWEFTDPDTGDSQSAYELRWRLVGAPTWTTTGAVFGVLTARTLPPGTFVAGDYEWQVRTYDATGTQGPFSASSFFTAGTVPGAPTIVSPTSGATIPANSAFVEWSTPSQTAYQIQRVADFDGVINPTTVYSDTGEVTQPDARTAKIAFPTNNRWEHIRVRFKSGGLWSEWASVRVQVSYTPPETPIAAVDASDLFVQVYVSNPAPGEDVPAAEFNDIYRAPVGDTAAAIRVATSVAPNSWWTDEHVGHLEDVTYMAVANAANGTTAPSEWASDTVEVPSGMTWEQTDDLTWLDVGPLITWEGV